MNLADYLELVVEVLDLLGDLDVGHEKVVTARDGLHDVSLDLLVLEDGHAAVDEDGRLRRLKVGSKLRTLFGDFAFLMGFQIFTF